MLGRRKRVSTYKASDQPGLILRSVVSGLLASFLVLQSLFATAARTANGEPTRDKSLAKEASEWVVQPDQTIVVYGPHRFDRTGLLTKSSDQFTLPADVFAPFTMEIQNGDAGGAGRVLIGSIRLNGSVIFSSMDLNLQAPNLTQQVTLASHNAIEVSYFSRRSAFLSITVTGTKRSVPPRAPSITDFNPKSGAVGTP